MRSKHIFLILCLLATGLTLNAQPDHVRWDRLLRQYVDVKGMVDYLGFSKEVQSLNDYLAQLKAYPPEESWTDEEEMAFWINAYNAFTIRLILDHFPVKSIRDISGGNPWDEEWITIGQLTYSLNEIEYKMLRARFGDPRIHFAINCAAKSCPPLLNRAFLPQGLDQLLDMRARAFINNPNYNLLGVIPLQISKIFEWYSEDFGDIRPYLSRYSSLEIPPDAPVTYREYNWDLNDQ